MSQQPEIETPAYVEFVRRTLARLATRAGAEDEIELGLLIRLERFIQECIAQAVARQRARGISWSRIGQATGITKQTAQERWRNAVPMRYTNTKGWHL